MDKEVIDKLEHLGLTSNDLTQDELSQLKDEIKAEKEGYEVLDGVLHNPEILLRRLAQERTPFCDRPLTIFTIHIKRPPSPSVKARNERSLLSHSTIWQKNKGDLGESFHDDCF